MELDTERKDAWRAFLTAHARLLERIDGKLAAADVLPLDWYDVLLALEEAEGNRLRMGELAQNTLLSRSGLTRLVDRIEAAGYLRRENCPSDRRGFYAVLTDEGREARRRTWPVYSEAIVELFARHLSDAETRTLAGIFARMLAEEPAPAE